MKSLIYFGILVFICITVRGQPTYFSKLYDIANNSQVASSVIELPGLGYVAAADHITPIKRGLILLKVDLEGNKIWEKVYGEPPTIYSTIKIILLADSSYLVCGGITDTDGAPMDGLLAKFNQFGDSIWFRRYGGSDWDYFWDFELRPDGGVALFGHTSSKGNGGADYWLVVTDSLGNLLWDTTYGGSGNDIGHTIDITSDSGYILSGSSKSFGDMPYTIKIDKNGIKLWDLSTDVNLSGFALFSFQTANEDYIIYGCKGNGDGSNAGKDGFMTRIGSDGSTVIWERTFGSPELDFYNKAIELDDGSLIAVGSSRGNPKKEVWGWIIKISADGDSIWSRDHYVNDEIANFFYDIKPTEDKGFIACGSAFPEGGGSQDLWLLKLDSMGCLVPGCDTLLDPPVDPPGIGGVDPSLCKIPVHPNPMASSALVQIMTCQLSDQTTFGLFDIFGRTLRTIRVQSQDEILLERNELPVGIYFYRLISNGAVIGSGKLIME